MPGCRSADPRSGQPSGLLCPLRQSTKPRPPMAGHPGRTSARRSQLRLTFGLAEFATLSAAHRPERRPTMLPDRTLVRRQKLHPRPCQPTTIRVVRSITVVEPAFTGLEGDDVTDQPSARHGCRQPSRARSDPAGRRGPHRGSVLPLLAASSDRRVAPRFRVVCVARLCTSVGPPSRAVKFRRGSGHDVRIPTGQHLLGRRSHRAFDAGQLACHRHCLAPRTDRRH
ncbi:MAG: hypothetical protein JWP07_2314 [Pseudonocardiales bacterium]|nr:hypothetical protein [Pseudonocardiales bacterium]